MTRFIALAFALTLASSVQAMPRAPVQEPQDVIIKIREACGAGMHRVNGVCVSDSRPPLGQQVRERSDLLITLSG
jgi:hypothetical protein